MLRLCRTIVYLEDRVQAVVERIKVGPGLDVGGANFPDFELAAKDLRPQQSENAQEEEEQNEQGDDGFDTVDQRRQQVPQGLPVSACGRGLCGEERGEREVLCSL